MANTDDRLQASGEQLKGRLKEGAGKVLDDKSLEYEGKADQAKGEAHEEAAKAKGRVEGTLNEVKGKANEALGDLTDDETREARGEAQKWAGRAQRKANE